MRRRKYGCIYSTKYLWVARIRLNKKLYEKRSRQKEEVEEWLNNFLEKHGLHNPETKEEEKDDGKTFERLFNQYVQKMHSMEKENVEKAQ